MFSLKQLQDVGDLPTTAVVCKVALPVIQFVKIHSQTSIQPM